MKLFIKNKTFDFISSSSTFALEMILMLDEKNLCCNGMRERDKEKKNLHIMPQIYGAAHCVILFYFG